MKALSPGRPPAGQRLGLLSPSRGLSLLSKGSSLSPSSSLEADPLSLLYNMNDCYSKLKELVPSIPNNKKVSRMEILQHVIDYILDLQIALDNNSNTSTTHLPNRNPSLGSSSSSSSSSRSPLAALNTDITILSLQAAEFPSELMSNDSKALCG